MGRAGVVVALAIDFSDVGGDGGVRVSETSEEADFVGGVAMVGEELDVVGDSCDSADWGRACSGAIGGGFL